MADRIERRLTGFNFFKKVEWNLKFGFTCAFQTHSTFAPLRLGGGWLESVTRLTHGLTGFWVSNSLNTRLHFGFRVCLSNGINLQHYTSWKSRQSHERGVRRGAQRAGVRQARPTVYSRHHNDEPYLVCFFFFKPFTASENHVFTLT